MRHDPGKPTSSVVTPVVVTQNQQQMNPRKASGSDMARCWETNEQRRDADVKHHI
jgi:hypothetical protein